MDTTAVYRSTRVRIRELVRSAPAGSDDTPVPACPGWTAKDLLAHLAGVCEDIVAGRLEGVATEPWTQSHVDRFATATATDVLDSWERAAAEAETLFGSGGAPAQLVFDEVTHEHDLRGALGIPGGRQSDAVVVGSGFAVGAVGQAFTARGLPAVRFRFEDGDDAVAGTGEPGATLTVDRFDLLRSASGRRTADQIAALDWGGTDPAPWLPAFAYGPFTLPEAPVE
jgi:uncharacterized protein (TIGR03083 family)